MGERLTRVALTISGRRAFWWLVPVAAGGLALLAATVSPGPAGSPGSPSPVAEAKANQLLAAFARAGLPPPSTVDNLWTVLGEDGGVVCETAASPEHLAYLKKLPSPLSASHVFQSLVLVVETYCPDRLPPLRLLAGRAPVTHV